MHSARGRETILIIDDTPENLRVLGEVLQPTYLVRVANTGKRALEVVLTPPMPDLILLDVMMPVMDGYECLQHLREDPRTRDIPVIFVTALDATEDERLGLELGAVDYIAKPIRPAIVQARVRNALDMKRARDWLKDQNAFLETELNRFLDILAHHLQEPVRHQVIYSQLLRRSVPQPLNRTAQMSLDEIIEGAGRLRAMLRDVLLYLATHQTLPPSEPCSAEAAFDAALREVSEHVETIKAEVSRGPLPPVWVCPNRLSDVFRAILENAIEYRSPQRPLRVRVTAEPAGTHAIFAIRDNGIGIPSEFRERVFEVFERLHADQDRPGTGIGLALVRRVAEQAKGRAWIEDGEDGGARICFSLPLNVEAVP